ncbi:MAG: hypothetical protein KJ051_14090 [Thermoleophilia bacterium]|nr:hypothetical protein [Thermoleophilia bacterium]
MGASVVAAFPLNAVGDEPVASEGRDDPPVRRREGAARVVVHVANHPADLVGREAGRHGGGGEEARPVLGREALLLLVPREAREERVGELYVTRHRAGWAVSMEGA